MEMSSIHRTTIRAILNDNIYESTKYRASVHWYEQIQLYHCMFTRSACYGVPPKYTPYTLGDETKVLAFKPNSIKDIFIQKKKKAPYAAQHYKKFHTYRSISIERIKKKF